MQILVYSILKKKEKHNQFNWVSIESTGHCVLFLFTVKHNELQALGRIVIIVCMGKMDINYWTLCIYRYVYFICALYMVYGWLRSHEAGHMDEMARRGHF